MTVHKPEDTASDSTTNGKRTLMPIEVPAALREEVMALSVELKIGFRAALELAAAKLTEKLSVPAAVAQLATEIRLDETTRELASVENRMAELKAKLGAGEDS
jgi:hypothetical protein